MKNVTVAALAIFLSTGLVSTAAFGEQPVSWNRITKDLREVERQTLPARDNALLTATAIAEEEARGPLGAPYRFAEPITIDASSATTGTWEDLADGSRLWRMTFTSPGALTISVRLDQLTLPEGSRFWLYSADRQQVWGPYDRTDINRVGDFWSPRIHGESLTVELHDPTGSAHFRFAEAQHGFRGFPFKADACNNDTSCPEAAPWSVQKRAAARLIMQNTFVCSGQLVNNTAQNGVPYLLTAYHCILDSQNNPQLGRIDSTEATFNFESPVCGALSGGPETDVVNGASFVAGDQTTDFLLIRLDSQPPANFNVHYAGWDVTGNAPSSATSIHHPNGDEKAISFDDDALTTDGEFFPGGTHWKVGDWEDGSTQRGSSGSCIFNNANGLCVGVLTGGFAACQGQARPEDYYGKLSAAWNAGATAEGRLRDWLDPGNTGATTLAGMDPAGGSGCTPTATNMCLNNGRFKVEVDWETAAGDQGQGQVATGNGTDDSGIFYYFNPNNFEMLIKVLDNCNGFTNRFWVFAAATTTVEYTLTVTDTQTGATKSYFNAQGVSSPAITDTQACATCP